MGNYKSPFWTAIIKERYILNTVIFTHGQARDPLPK